MNRDKRKYLYIIDLIFLAVVAAFAFWVNRDIVIKGLYMDDLYMWSCYGEQSLTEFVFPIGTSTRFRPVYWFATYLQMMIVGNHITRFVAFNVIVNVITAYLLYYISRRLSRSRICALITALCYLASRFAYYQIGQALGLMETMALFLAIAMLWQLYRYMEEAKGYWSALIIYFLLVFTHERYLSLFPLIYLVLVIRRLREKSAAEELRATFAGQKSALSMRESLAKSENEDICAAEDRGGFDGQNPAHKKEGSFAKSGAETALKMQGSFAKSDEEGICASANNRRCTGFLGKCAVPLIELILIVAIRCFAIGKAIPAGTGGTEVTETFGIKQALGFCFDQVRYIFGINAGPEYLNGLTWEDTPSYIRNLVYIGIVLISAVVLIYVLDIVRKHSHKALREAFETGLLFGGFIALCIGCSSVTIRLEMRWIYVSFAAALLYASYMIGSLAPACGRICDNERNHGYNHIEGRSRKQDRTQAQTYAQSRMCDNERNHGYNHIVCLFIAYALVSIYINIFYRGYYIRLYLWPNQLRMNSLAEQTVEKYGLNGILGETIYILGNSYEMSEFYADTFFKTFDPDMKAEGTEVIFIDSMEDADREKLKDGTALILKELPEDNAYLDITEEALAKLNASN